MNYTYLSSLSLSFSINSKTGVISTGSQIDREARETVKLTVQAQDGGNPSLTSRCSVIVDIIDYNDNDPRVSFFLSIFKMTVRNYSVKVTRCTDQKNVKTRSHAGNRTRVLWVKATDASPYTTWEMTVMPRECNNSKTLRLQPLYRWYHDRTHARSQSNAWPFWQKRFLPSLLSVIFQHVM